MLKVMYDWQSMEGMQRIEAVKAIRRAFPQLSLKEAKDFFEEGVLFCTGAQWDILDGNLSHGAMVCRAAMGEEKQLLAQKMRRLRAERDSHMARVREIDPILSSLALRLDTLP